MVFLSLLAVIATALIVCLALNTQVRSAVAYTQAFGCRLCLHVGSIAFFFGRKRDGRGPRIEVLTPLHKFRYSRGYRDVRKVACAIVLVALGIGFCAEDASAQRFRGARLGAVARAARFARNVAFRGIRRSSALFVPFGVGVSYGNVAQVREIRTQVIQPPPVVVQQTSTYLQQQAPVIVQQDVGGCAAVSNAVGGCDAGAAFGVGNFIGNRGFGARGFRGRR